MPTPLEIELRAENDELKRINADQARQIGELRDAVEALLAPSRPDAASQMRLSR